MEKLLVCSLLLLTLFIYDCILLLLIVVAIDVSVGSILGIFCATISYYQYYPELTHPECHLPLRHKTSPKFHRTMSDSRLSKGTRTWALEDSAENSVPLLEVKEM